MARCRCYLSLFTLYLKPSVAATSSNCAQIHAICTRNKVLLTQKIDLSRMCTTQSRVHYSETCPELFLLHYSVAFCFLTERKPKTSKIWPFQSTIRTSVQNSSNQDSHLRKPTVPKVMHFAQERTFSWHTSATRPECAPIHLLRYRPSCYTPPNSMKAKNLVKSTVSVLFASLCTKDHEPTDAAPSSNWKQNHALSTNNEVSMNDLCNVQNVHCCASRTVGLPNSTVSVLFNPL